MNRHSTRVSLLALLMVCTSVVAPTTATAGPLLDWLLGRRVTAAYPIYPNAAVATPTTAYYAAAAPITSFYGTGNVYPSYPTVGAVAPIYGAAPYTAAMPSPVATTAYSLPLTSANYAVPAIAPVTAYAYPTAAPVNPYPTTIATAPAYPAYPAATTGGLFDGLRRLFRPDWTWTPAYTTSYYPAEVTYYRPVTTLSPTTGVPVTGLSACTSYQMQVQRLPTTSVYQPVAPAIATPCGSPCDYSGTTAVPYAGTTTMPPSTYPAPTATYPAPTNGYPAPTATYPAPTANPYPLNPTYPPISNGANDITPVPQPQMVPSQSNYPPSYRVEPAPTSTAPTWPSLGTSASGVSRPLPSTDPVAQPRPIPAPSDLDSDDRRARQASYQSSTFKTIQWTTAASPAVSAPPSVKPTVRKYDDSGWK